jgi:RNA polymerase sigma factor (TIGR02999 family)
VASDEPGGFTKLLQQAKQGQGGAEDALFELVYAELKAMARRRMFRVPSQDTLQPTALVHETYLRMVGRDALGWSGRRHFFALAARAMHDIMVEQARRHAALKRGGRMRRVELDADEVDPAQAPQAPLDVLALSEGIEALRQMQPLAADVVYLRFFAGLSYDEIARALEIPVIKARREWAYAKAYLHERMSSGSSSGRLS